MGSAAGQGAASGAASGASIGTQILPGWGTAIGAVVGGIAGGIGGGGIDSAKTKLKNTINEYMAQMANLDMPRYEDLKVIFQKSVAGEPLTPQELTALQDVNSEVAKIAQDKIGKTAQLEALAGLKARSRGGLTLQDKADLLQAQREIDRQQSGVQKAIISNMAARGHGGSGAELAARLSAGQAGAQQASQNALNIAAQSRTGALNALKDSAAMGRQIGQDQLEFDKMRAQANDETRRSNLTRLQNAMQYNVGNINKAKEYNQNRQNLVSDRNVDLSNEEQLHNKGVLWQDYQHQVGRIDDEYKTRLGQAQSGVQDASNQAAGIMGTINSIGGMVGGMKDKFGGSGTAQVSNTSGSGPSLTGGAYAGNKGLFDMSEYDEYGMKK